MILREGRGLFLGTKEEIRVQIPALREDASLEEFFFRATEGGAAAEEPPAAAPAAPASASESPRTSPESE